MRFSQDLINTNVTSLKIVGDFVLAGIGSILFVYDINAKKTFSKRIFIGQKIHGIIFQKCSERLLVIFGGKQISIGSFTENGIFHEITQLKICDWIHAVSVLNDLNLVVVTAHNQVEIWNWKSSNKIRTSTCQEKCILYCCCIVGNDCNDLIVLSGTVFSEVIVWAPTSVHVSESGGCPVLQRITGHDGVIFSISINTSRTLICTTSDDRSVSLWTVKNNNISDSVTNWKNCKIELLHCLYGHNARVWRSIFVNNESNVVSVGEDGIICLWSAVSGKLLKKLSTYQNCPIWSLDVSRNVFITGDDSGSITKWPVNLLSSTPNLNIIEVPEVPRKILLIPSHDNFEVLTVTDSGSLYLSNGNQSYLKFHNEILKNYCLLNISQCQKHISLCSINGQVTILNYGNFEIIFDKKLINGKIFSFHWLNNEFVTCSEHGSVNIWSFENFNKIHEFILPKSKERWANCVLKVNSCYIIGDRMGSLFLYKESIDPVQKFIKIHSYLGVCDIIEHDNLILTTGRDGTVKKFIYKDNCLEYINHISLPFSWCCKMIKTDSGLFVTGFTDKSFVVWSETDQSILFRILCGGGHRSWNCSVTDTKSLMFAFIKNKQIHTVEFNINDAKSKSVTNWFHSREINCLKSFCFDSFLYFISGGEDTLVKISKYEDKTLQTCSELFNHKSSIKCVTICQLQDETIIFTGGGRAQIVVSRFKNNLLFEVTEHTENKSVNPDTRYMDLSCIEVDKCNVVLVAGSSDGTLRIFNFNFQLKTLTLIKTLMCSNYCILRVCCVVQGNTNLVLVMTTDGYLSFWDISKDSHVCPVFNYKLHQSGINSYDLMKLINRPNEYLLVSGGDDNMITFTLISVGNHVSILNSWSCSSLHACQITGVKFYKNLVFTCSIDQRVSVLTWNLISDRIDVSYIDQYMSDIADIHGLDLFVTPNRPDQISVCVYGKGYEIIHIDDVDTELAVTVKLN